MIEWTWPPGGEWVEGRTCDGFFFLDRNTKKAVNPYAWVYDKEKKNCAVDYDSAFSPGWRSIKGRFISVIGANISCACAKSPEGLSPSAHLADGCLDLILVRHTSRLQYLRHMIRISSRADQVNIEIPFAFFCSLSLVFIFLDQQ